MSNTFSEILYQRGPEVNYRGRYIPLDEWQARRRQDAKQNRKLRIATVIAGIITFCWFTVPGLINIWRG